MRLAILCLVLATCANAHPWMMGRIVGGIESSVEKRPFQASLQTISAGVVRHRCGASIISPRHLMSAAHCDPGTLGTVYVRVGSTAFNTGGQSRKVAAFLKHPSYNPSQMDFDFAIITLAAGEDIIYGPNVQPVKLADAEGPDAGSTTTVSGWGVTNENNPSSAPVNLREVNLPVWSNNDCSAIYNFLTSRHMCLGGTSQGGTSACFGDSGGPVTYNNIQVALVTGGRSCSDPGIPGIYSRIASVRQWIQQNTGV